MGVVWKQQKQSRNNRNSLETTETVQKQMSGWTIVRGIEWSESWGREWGIVRELRWRIGQKTIDSKGKQELQHNERHQLRASSWMSCRASASASNMEVGI
jgi:hypothetical protein